MFLLMAARQLSSPASAMEAEAASVSARFFAVIMMVVLLLLGAKLVGDGLGGIWR